MKKTSASNSPQKNADVLPQMYCETVSSGKGIAFQN
jgi:hypothetical protein